MKGNAIARIVLYSLLALVLSAVLVVGILIGNLSIDFGSSGGTTVESEVSLDAAGIRKLEIDWASGAVTINVADTDQITIREQAPENSKYKMTYDINGSTLELSYGARKISFGFGDSAMPGKDLVITVPRDWICEQIEIDGAALTIHIQHLTVEKIDLDGASNALAFVGSVETVDIDGAANNIHLNCENHPTLIDIDGASCELDLILPKGCGFAVEMNGLSCNFHSDLKYTTKNGQYIYGNGHTNVSADGISCDVTVSESAECAHVWDAGQELTPPGGGLPEMVYTCKICGETKSEPIPSQNIEKNQQYMQAVSLLAQGKKAEAAITFGKLGDYMDARERCTEIWSQLRKNATVSGREFLAGILTDGSMITMGSSRYPLAEAAKWTDMRSVSISMTHILGIRSNGTVLAAGDNSFGQCNVSTWTNIVSVFAGEHFSVGLKSNGTVVYAGTVENNVLQIANWTNIAMLAVSDHHIVGLKNDGTVVAAGKNNYGQCDLPNISDVIHVYADNLRTVLLCADGSLINIGSNTYALQETHFPELQTYDVVADCHYGMMADGSYVCLQYDDSYPVDLASWQDSVAFLHYYGRLFGLQPDGSMQLLYAFSEAEPLPEDLSTWTDILIP